MQKPEKQKYEVDIFYHYANEYKLHATDDSEIEKIDFTEEAMEGFHDYIKLGQPLKVQIWAPPFTGKSLFAMAITNELMEEHYGRSLNITDIDRDQQEHSIKVRDPKLKNTIRVVDEQNELAETGENSTIEQKFRGYQSDVMGQRNIHAFFCTPTKTMDPNIQIFLQLFSTDRVRKLSHAKVFYKVNAGGIEYLQILGILTIDVSKILKMKWYKEYRRRKFEKMELIIKEGIFQPDQLIYAELVLNIVEKLKPLTREIRLPTNNMVTSRVRAEWRRAKMGLSIPGRVLATDWVNGILDGYKEYWKTIKQIKSLEKEYKQGAKTKVLITHDEYKSRMKQLEITKSIIMEDVNFQEEELRKYKAINDKYNKIIT